MPDSVNTKVRQKVEVRPFMAGALIAAEERMAKHDGKKTVGDAQWADFANAAHVSINGLFTLGAVHRLSVEDRKRHLADALNYIGMAYDKLEQGE